MMSREEDDGYEVRGDAREQDVVGVDAKCPSARDASEHSKCEAEFGT